MSGEGVPFAVGGLDASRLHETLDLLQHLIVGHLTPSSGPVVGGFDRGRVLESVRIILHRIETTSDREVRPAPGRLLPGLADDAPDMSEILMRLQGGLAQRLEKKLGARKLDTIRGLLRRDVPDFLGLLGQIENENLNSAILRWLLDPHEAPSIAPAALAALVSEFEDRDQWRVHLENAIQNGVLRARCEYVIAREWTNEDRLDRIDIVVAGPQCILAIENKIRAREHDAQTESYWAWLKPLPLLRAGLFLSPAGLPPASTGFRAISYLDLLACLLEGAVHGRLSPHEEIVLSSYVKSLTNGVLRTELRLIG